MVRRRLPLIAVLLTGVLVTTLWAQDGAPRTGAPETRLERSVALAAELASATQRLRATVELLDDVERRALEGPLADLDAAVAEAQALAKPIESLEQLSEGERETLAGLLSKSTTRRGDGWRQAALARAFRSVETEEVERAAAEKIVLEWFDAAFEARMQHDSKRSAELKRERDERLSELLGRKRARRVGENLDSYPGGSSR